MHPCSLRNDPVALAECYTRCRRIRFPKMPFNKRKLDEGDITPYHYVYVPENSGDELIPIIVFLHGAGERGFEPGLILQGGLGAIVERARPPAIVLFPQCQEDHRAFYGRMEDRVYRAVADAVENLNGDPKRVYLIGYSMGATSSIYLSVRHPHLFSGIVSIAVGLTWPEREWPENFTDDPQARDLFSKMFVGEGHVSFIAERIKDIPIWLLHGDEDDACPFHESVMLVDELQKLGAPVKFTEYENVGHDTLLMSFEKENLFQWLLQQPSTQSA